MTDVQTERLIKVGPESFATYYDVATYLQENRENLGYVSRELAMVACGGLVQSQDEYGVDFLQITDGQRTVQRRRGGEMSRGPVSFAVDPAHRYTAEGVVIAQIDYRDSTMFDRGLAWIALSRNDLTHPLVTVWPFGASRMKDTAEIAERLEVAEQRATALLDDFLNGVESPRFAHESSPGL